MISSPVNSPGNKPRPPRKSIVALFLDLKIITVVGYFVIFFMAAANLVNINVTEDNTVSLDPQLQAKLAIAAIAAMYGAYGFLLDSRVRKLLLSLPGLWLTALGGIYVATAMTSFDKTISIVSAGMLVGAIMAITTFAVREGRQAALRLLFMATATFVMLSWFVYLAVPEIGVFYEPLPGGKFLHRMGGLSHPNTMGQFSALALILGAIQLRLGTRYRGIVILVMMAAGMSLIFSVSRTSAVAAIVGLAVVYRDQIFKRNQVTWGLIALVLGVGVIGLGVVFLDFDQKIDNRIASLLSKSSESDSDELTSATGRTVIWAKSISLINERPLTGWGAGTSKELLKDYTFYTHNLFLNVLLSTGIIGGLLIAGLMFSMLWKAARKPSVVADALIVFIFLNGLMENVIFSNVPSAPTLVFVLAVLWRYFPMVVSDSESQEQGGYVVSGA